MTSLSLGPPLAVLAPPRSALHRPPEMFSFPPPNLMSDGHSTATALTSQRHGRKISQD
jgi:hypothetical protein